MRKRKERADRIVRLLAAIEAAPELRESAYGWLSLTAKNDEEEQSHPHLGTSRWDAAYTGNLRSLFLNSLCGINVASARTLM